LSPGPKHTTYFTSRSRVLTISGLGGPVAVTLALATSIAAYLMAYSLAMRQGLLIGGLISLGGLAVFGVEALALRFVWGSNFSFINARRLAVAYSATNVAWMVALIPAAVLGKPSLVLYSVFPFWAARAYIIGGVFSHRSPRSVSAVISTALAPLYNMILEVQRTALGSILPMALGLPLVVTAGVSLGLLERGRVGGLRSLSAFMEAWSGSRGGSLELLMSELGDDGKARGYLIRASRFIAAVPYVHPGPFRPVGSYNVPEVLAGELDGLGCAAVLHGAVDHGRNLSSNAITREFASRMAREASSDGFEEGALSPMVTLSGSRIRLRGLWIGAKTLLLIIEPVEGLEDYGDAVVERLEALGDRYGVRVIAADAHNSLGPDPGEDEVAELLSLAEEMIRRGPPAERIVRCGCARRPGAVWPDIGSAGISALALEDGAGHRLAIVVVDSNNAVPGFRHKVDERLRSLGFDSSLLCTTDTHETTGISRTDRGYSALGEVEDGILDIIEGAAGDALRGMAECGAVGAKEFSMDAKFAGDGFLSASKDMASRSIRIAKLTLIVALVLAAAGYISLALL